MKRFVVILMMLCSTALTHHQALAKTTLDLLPSHQTVRLGETAVVYLHVSGLTPAQIDPAVGLVDIDVTYGDPNKTLKFRSAVFGPHLGDPADPTQTIINVQDSDGFVWIREESLLKANQLDALQREAVTIVAIKFRARKTGIVVIPGDLFSLKDQFGNDLISAQGSVGSAIIEVVLRRKNLPPSFR